MSERPEDRAWDIITNTQSGSDREYIDGWAADDIIDTLIDAGLLIGMPTDRDRARLEEIRAKDIQRRVAEDKGIMQGMRERMNVAFLLDYIDKLERRNNG
jgi:hypothetical protein